MIKNVLVIIFLCLVFFVNAQNILSTQVDLNYKNIKLKKLFSEMEKNYDIQFSYSYIPSNKRVSITFKGDLQKGLYLIFNQTRLQYKIINNQIVVQKRKRTILKAKIKGRIISRKNSLPILSANIVIKNYKEFIGTSSDIDGYFSLPNLPIGRYDIHISALGYKEKYISQVLVSTGKNVHLDISLTEKINTIEEVIIVSKVNKYEPINQMASTSARTFSVEETERYVGSISDPARMAQNYAGVTNAGDDSSNDLVIRGNSPRGLLWRLEGIEIPNPNHFGNTGAKGGIVSMLSSSILNNSDFYTSTFPSEFGNATSGVFDLRFRNGNTEKREHSIGLSLQGINISTEGYFTKKSKASYVFKFRFSTINYIKPLIIELKDADLTFRDLSFKINIPSKKLGTFSIFALGGQNSQVTQTKIDSFNRFALMERNDYFESQSMGVIGISNKKTLSNKTLLKNVVSATIDNQRRTIDIYDTIPEILKIRINDTDFKSRNYLFATTLTHQLNKRNLIQIGANYEFKKFNYFVNLNQNDSNYIFFNSNGFTHFVQSFTSWKYEVSKKTTLTTGFHFSYLHLNKTYAFDPRIGIKRKLNEKHSLSFSTGLFSRPEHISTYLMENTLGLSLKPNMKLEMNRSFQIVLSYNYKFAKDYNFKTEAYYQYLFYIPVSVDTSSSYSTINSENIFDILVNNSNGGELTSEGKGNNFGIDLTVEKFFSKKYYAMFTASIFESTYKNLLGEKFHTKFANNYLLNLIGGKEFVVGKLNNNLINLNGKFIFNGGRRYTPIDIEKTILTEIEFRNEDKIFSKQFQPYYRLDLGFNYKMNTRNITHTFSIDVQNFTNHKNNYSIFFNFETDKIETKKQLGIIPFLKYKAEFSFKNRKNKQKTL